MSLLDANEAAKTQGMGVLLGAALSTFPDGTYGYYMGEYFNLGALNYANADMAEASADTDMLIQIWDEISPELLERIKARASDSPHIWISAQDDVWVTDAGMTQIYDLFDDDDKDEIGCYVFERGGEPTLFSAVDFLIYRPIASMESAWGDVNPDDYSPDEDTREKLSHVEDPLVRGALQIVLGNDAHIFNIWRAPAALSAETQGVHEVCEIEDQCQQDFVNRVLYLPAGGLKG